MQYYVEAESDAEIGDGFLPKTDDWRAEVEWADEVLRAADRVGQGNCTDAMITPLKRK